MTFSQIVNIYNWYKLHLEIVNMNEKPLYSWYAKAESMNMMLFIVV